MQTEKETTFTQARPVECEERAFPDAQWKTGVKARFPWVGFGALFTVLICAVSSILVLVLSNGKSQKHWPKKIAPNVIISGLNSITNICFGIAIGNGIAITWWRQALKGATIQELHRSWTFSSSMKDLVLGGRYFNVIALAALTAKLTIIDSMLLQRATSTKLDYDKGKDIDVYSYANDTLPYTALTGDRSGNVSYFANWFTENMATWSSNGGIFENTYVQCDGTCLFDIPGIGFEIDCISEDVNMDYGAAAIQDALALSQSSDSSTFNGTYEYSLFSVAFQTVYGMTGVDGDYSKIIMNITSSSALNGSSTGDGNGVCPGTVTRHNCQLRPATIRYPVTVVDNTLTDTKDPISNMYLGYNTTFSGGSLIGSGDQGYNADQKQQAGYQVLGYRDVLEDHLSVTSSKLTAIGGIGKALTHYFQGSGSMHYDAIAGGFVLAQSGLSEMDLGSAPSSTGGCDFYFIDPLNDIVRQINSLMFTLAVDPYGYNADNQPYGTTKFKAIQYGTSIHYKTNIAYMCGAVASMLVCVLCVLPSYYGFWQLGRKVTLGPFEIANAFRAPVLDHPRVANAGVDALIKEVGSREVKYGEMVSEEAPGRLAIAEPEIVRRVHPRIHDLRP